MRAVTIYIRPNPPIADNMMPLEWEYVDDADFADEDTLQQLLPICSETLKEWNLTVNESKAEFKKVYLADKDEVDVEGEPIRHREEYPNLQDRNAAVKQTSCTVVTLETLHSRTTRKSGCKAPRSTSGQS